MCFNDDFDFDGYDDMDDPGDDFAEDMFNESELDPVELDMEAESEEPVINEPDDPEAAFDFQDAFILGGMIVGQAYEEALDEKEQTKKKKND
jgi:hypothetical protein